jgi:hypothetical protein
MATSVGGGACHRQAKGGIGFPRYAMVPKPYPSGTPAMRIPS